MHISQGSHRVQTPSSARFGFGFGHVHRFGFVDSQGCSKKPKGVELGLRKSACGYCLTDLSVAIFAQAVCMHLSTAIGLKMVWNQVGTDDFGNGDLVMAEPSREAPASTEPSHEAPAGKSPLEYAEDNAHVKTLKEAEAARAKVLADEEVAKAKELKAEAQARVKLSLIHI